jgi:NADPH:quinone reductase-like Zn-dependent oxidoreductase
VQITRFGGPEGMDIVDLPDPVPGDGEQLYDISSSGVDYADTHHRQSANRTQSRVASRQSPFAIRGAGGRRGRRGDTPANGPVT